MDNPFHRKWPTNVLSFYYQHYLPFVVLFFVLSHFPLRQHLWGGQIQFLLLAPCTGIPRAAALVSRSVVDMDAVPSRRSDKRWPTMLSGGVRDIVLHQILVNYIVSTWINKIKHSVNGKELCYYSVTVQCTCSTSLEMSELFSWFWNSARKKQYSNQFKHNKIHVCMY